MEEKYFSNLYKIGSLQKAKGGELFLTVRDKWFMYSKTGLSAYSTWV